MTMTASLLALRADWMFDGYHPVPDPTVIIDGSTVLAAGPGLPVPDGARVIDLPGATILPGLIDTHVHLAFDASADPVARLAGRDDAAAFAAMAAAARTAVRAGITTVRDLGDRGYLSVGLREAAAADPSLPTVIAAGPPITTPSGHCHYLGGAVSGVDGVREAVRVHADRGVNVIKIMASGGALTPGTRIDEPQFTFDELRAAVAEAHRYGLPVTAHAHGTRPVLDALRAGVDGLEHASFMTVDGVDEVPDEVLSTIGSQPVTIGLTFGFVPGGPPPPAAIAARLPLLLRNARTLYAAGAVVVVGTDGGIGPAKPHDVLPWGIGQLTGLGMSHVEALRAGTSRAAAACGVAGSKGRIATGYDADLLVVDGDPVEDLAALLRVRAVYVRGTELSDAIPLPA